MPITSQFVIRSTIGLLAVGFLALLGIVGMTIWLGERSQIYFNELIAARDIRSAAVDLRSALQAAESSQRGFLGTGNEIYLAPYDSAKAQTLRQLTLLKRNLAGDPQVEAVLQRLSAAIDEKMAEMDKTVVLKNNRQDAEALSILSTNRGKALMDESNVFLSGIIRRADGRLTTGVSEQNANAAALRWVSIVGGLIIVLVVGGVIVTILRYAREIAQARDHVNALNTSLEERVKLRTADLARARDRAEALVAEVNHRVANSLSLVASMVALQAKGLSEEAKGALDETEARIYAIASIHKRLYTSGDVLFVELDEYLKGLLEHLAASMRDEGSVASLRHKLEPVKLKTDASVSLGVVVSELVTNAFKYAYPGRPGEIRVSLKVLPEQRIELAVEDDGIGRTDAIAASGTGLGTRIVNAMAGSLGGEIRYDNAQPGTVARLVFPIPHDHAPN
jgi:two-component sensor histidine kinase/CHASE3 domain sensor protein